MSKEYKNTSKTAKNLAVLRFMINKYMRDNNVRQYDVAQKLAIAESTVSKWMNVDDTNPYDSTIKKTAKALGYHIEKQNGEWSVDRAPIVAEPATSYNMNPIKSSLDELFAISEKTTDRQAASEIKKVITRLSMERARIYQELADVRAMVLYLKEKYEGQ